LGEKFLNKNLTDQPKNYRFFSYVIIWLRVNYWDMQMTTQPYIMMILRLKGAIPAKHPMTSWRVQ